MMKEFTENTDIQICEKQMNLRKGELLQMLNLIGTIIHDEEFVTHTTAINKEIWAISRDN